MNFTAEDGGRLEDIARWLVAWLWTGRERGWWGKGAGLVICTVYNSLLLSWTSTILLSVWNVVHVQEDRVELPHFCMGRMFLPRLPGYVQSN